MSTTPFAAVAAFSLATLSAATGFAQPADPGSRASGSYVCDVAYESCRDDVIALIQNETMGIDLSFWFMTDARYSNEIVKRWKAGVPVRIIMDPRANTSKPANATQLQQFRDAGIPMLNKPFGDIAHWKGMIFAAQNVAEFSGANYSPYEYVYEIPYVQYQDEAIYVSHEPDVVQSLMRRFDDVWLNGKYTFYANAIPRLSTYPTSYTIAPEFNLPPDDSYYDRLRPLLEAENGGIDVVMFRITDPRPANALISAVGRGVPVRLYAEPLEYRNPNRREDSYNVDRMYMGGVHIRMRSHAGQNHQKTVRLLNQKTVVFGTSNWSTASDDNQLEVNYFTTKEWFYRFFADQFEWKWNNRPPDGSTTAQTTEFVPLPPDAPSYRAPAKATTAVNPGSVTLTWYAGPWARKYDLYLGAGSSPVPVRTGVELGPSQSTSDYKSFTVTGLTPGTTYSWKVVSRTMADVAAEGPLWTFTTAGTPVSTPPSADATPPSVVVYSPGRDAALSGTADLSASAWDNLAVVGVQFKVDGINVGAEDRSAPFRISWDTTLVSSGTHEVTAEARDNAGNRTTSAIVQVRVANDAPPADTFAPSVTLTAPADGSVLSGTTSITADSSDNVGVAGVQFKVDGINVGVEDRSAPFETSWDTTLVSSGVHEVTAEARDSAGNRTTSAIVQVAVANDTLPPDTVAPSVTLTAPADGSVLSGTTSITADSSDNVGVAGVQFTLDGVPLGTQDQTAPYAVSWDTAAAANGPHTLGAVARDAAGNWTTAAPVSVTVFNEIVAPPPSRTVVLHAADVTAENIVGNWVRSTDASAADGVALWNPDAGAGKIAPALNPPNHYVEISFRAEAGTPYHLWMRLRAQNDYFGNDSLHVQFYDAVDIGGAPIYRVGTSGAGNSAQVVLQESDGGKISGWGWADQGWNGLGTPIYFATGGLQTLRIQQREDGVMFDQIVLSPDTYSTAAPGSQTRDTTIVPR